VNSELEGRVALVTGGGSGIGAACVVALAACGAQVVVTDVDLRLAHASAESVRQAGGRALARRLDVTDPGAVRKCLSEVVATTGGLDVAVNNAGVAVPVTPAAEITDEQWQHVRSVNLDGVFYCLREELRLMRTRGGGSIINLSSVLGQVGLPGCAAYVSTKHAVIGLTKGAAIDHGHDGIRVNAVGPGFIRTPLLESRHTEQGLTDLAVDWPLRRVGLPSEVADMVVWLAGDRSSFVTGAYLPVDGGYLSI